MRDLNTHPSDQDLLLVTDGEATERRAAELRAHLEACWQCRARMAEIEATIFAFVRAQTNAAEQRLPDAAGPRALLRARLAALSENSARTLWEAFRCFLRGESLAYICAFVLLAAVVAGFLYSRTLTPESSGVAFAAVLPNPQLTPGAARTVEISELCSMPHDEVVLPVPTATRQQIFREYGVPMSRAGDYELDYLITPGLGGTDDIRNLWPQPHYDTTWNSFAKDRLEERLHEMVCAREIDLATAQRQIASNWVAAYKEYFDAGRNGLDHSR